MPRPVEKKKENETCIHVIVSNWPSFARLESNTFPADSAGPRTTLYTSDMHRRK